MANQRVSIIGSSSGASVVPGWNDYEFQLLEMLLFTEGVFRNWGNAFAVSEKGSGANMSVDVASGRALVEITNTNLSHGKTYKVHADIDGTENLTIATADATNPRKDRVVIEILVNTDPNGNSSNVLDLKVVTGTPAGSPSAPALPSVNSISLGIVNVPAGATSITNANIEDDRSFTDIKSQELLSLARQGLLNISASASGTDTITASMTPTVSSYSDRAIYGFIAANNNTGAVTLNIDGVGAKSVVKYDGVALEANDIRQNDFVLVAYEATNDRFRMLSQSGNNPSSASKVVQHKTANYSVSSADTGGVLTNKGATGDVIFDLPAASGGLNYEFVIYASQNVLVRAASGDEIAHETTAGEGWRNDTPYGCFRIVAIDSTTWIACPVVGTWTRYYYAGYLGGGSTASTTITRFIFADESCADISETMATGRNTLAGVSASEAGYWAGGGSYSDVVSKFNFSSETEANLAATLGTGRNNLASVQSSSMGYVLGGYNGSASNVIDDINFSDDTSSTVGTTLGTSRYGAGGVSSSTKGYVMGGQGPISSIEAFVFSGETISTLGATMSASRANILSGVQSADAGYCAGGEEASKVNKIEKFTFSSETSANLAATLGTARQRTGSVSGTDKGYFFGGDNAGDFTDIDDIDYATDASATLAAVLPTAKYGLAGISNPS